MASIFRSIVCIILAMLLSQCSQPGFNSSASMADGKRRGPQSDSSSENVTSRDRSKSDDSSNRRVAEDDGADGSGADGSMDSIDDGEDGNIELDEGKEDGPDIEFEETFRIEKCRRDREGSTLLIAEALYGPACAGEMAKLKLLAQSDPYKKLDGCSFGSFTSSSNGRIKPGFITSSEDGAKVNFFANDYQNIQDTTVISRDPLLIAIPGSKDCLQAIHSVFP